jgi:hypothetical protein
MVAINVHTLLHQASAARREQAAVLDMPEDRNLATGKVGDSTVVPLPEGDARVQLHLLDGGSFVASESIMHANVEERTFRACNWAFLVTHTDAVDSTQRHVLWDYGMSSVCMTLT